MPVARIYALVDRQTGEDRYVGVTVMALKDRLSFHRSPAAKNKLQVAQWARAADCGIRLLEECEASKRYKRERFWIRKMAKSGAALLNVAHC